MARWPWLTFYQEWMRPVSKKCWSHNWAPTRSLPSLHGWSASAVLTWFQIRRLWFGNQAPRDQSLQQCEVIHFLVLPSILVFCESICCIRNHQWKACYSQLESSRIHRWTNPYLFRCGRLLACQYPPMTHHSFLQRMV